MSRNNKVIVAYKLLLIVSWIVFWVILLMDGEMLSMYLRMNELN
ncbi:hypothetical protein Godav_022153 [Gossypium davidsonii]|uniref:Uncharacterized protein n=1 Tax=Gossypium davidsonii TaxID=34287 RepID=A0A7J8TAJ2_GOSDV|nr:hypothetical protein [Gossypium davidsonii]